ncbi:MAG: hypothetical protein NVSMB54_32860 [Ktedonobacteraceae bacterium]
MLEAARTGWPQRKTAPTPVPRTLHALIATKARVSGAEPDEEKMGKYKLLM